MDTATATTPSAAAELASAPAAGPLPAAALARLFEEARTHGAWLDQPVDDEVLHRLYDLTRLGPTGGNTQPLRVLFVRGAEAKERLRPTLSPGNVDKVMTAPVTAILAWDTRFFDKMPQLFPARAGMREQLGAIPEPTRERMATQSAHLQAGYFLLAARALGLDVGPLGGFDAAAVDRAFFVDSDDEERRNWRTLLLVNLGHGNPARLFPRLPRLPFEQATRVE